MDWRRDRGCFLGRQSPGGAVRFFSCQRIDRSVDFSQPAADVLTLLVCLCSIRGSPAVPAPVGLQGYVNAPLRLHQRPKRANAAILERIAPAACGSSSDPLQPEPPMNAAAFQQVRSARGSGGNALFGIPPATFRCTACESLRLPQASLRDCKQSLSLVALNATYVSTRESGPAPQASLHDCKQSLSLVALRMTFFRPV